MAADIPAALPPITIMSACSYAHTQMALKQGFSREEIEAFLSVSKAYVVSEEASAILFAQHYANSRARLFPDLGNRHAAESAGRVAGVISAHAGSFDWRSEKCEVCPGTKVLPGPEWAGSFKCVNIYSLAAVWCNGREPS